MRHLNELTYFSSILFFYAMVLWLQVPLVPQRMTTKFWLKNVGIMVIAALVADTFRLEALGYLAYAGLLALLIRRQHWRDKLLTLTLMLLACLIQEALMLLSTVPVYLLVGREVMVKQSIVLLFTTLLEFILTLIIFGILHYDLFKPAVKRFFKADPTRQQTFAIATIIVFAAFQFILLNVEYTRGEYQQIWPILVFIGLMSIGVVFGTQAFIHGQQLKAQAQKQHYEDELNRQFYENLEQNYSELRRFRHDFQNILLTLDQLLQSQNYQGARTFLNQVQTDKTVAKIALGEQTDDLIALKVPAVQGLFLQKLRTAYTQHIAVHFECRQPITDTILPPVTFNRISGILLDNALEAAKTAANPAVQVALIRYDADNLELVIQNNGAAHFKGDVFRYGVSAKSGHAGIGLSTVAKIVNETPGLALDYSQAEGKFSVDLMIARK